MIIIFVSVLVSDYKYKKISYYTSKTRRKIIITFIIYNDSTIMDKRERFNKAYNFLRSKAAFHTQKEAAQIMRASEPNMSSALSGNDKVLTDNFITRFNQAFGSLFNEEWLLTGKGEMLATTSSQNLSNVSAGGSIVSLGNGSKVGNVLNGNETTDSDSKYTAILEEIRSMRTDFNKREEKLLSIIENLTKTQ